MTNEWSANKRKYHILKFLKKLPYNEYTIAKRKLPVACKVSKRTFERWLYVNKEDRLEISADKLALIANYFNCTMEELLNNKIPKHNTHTLKRLHNQDLIKSLNLTK
ncbi:hypothetical protein [Aquimarina muelleri]|uniref:HTH cro/C1-type domain-containing protein n=1 Tax=Aquimarina muelleri TaxID=279356 RepID=A0A918N326_9FLAO|nr:hypothetical protein [Aquimarina muelleri]MCX2761845.1 hypothetical protein [Aquimarina muelleri]GGX23663.1 hypothetical protein GCM10007384_26100 [Aquimarina muelleri]